ncbi:MAG: hypothetical protein EOO42_10905 [Flavobacteriales bacterium]|nr:MAG: hypothetical protein EOO42_10905 [Flavobacteriales bacterium]
MKSLKMLAESTAVLSKTEMNCIKGGLKWTSDRSCNVEDRRAEGNQLLGQLNRLRDRSAMDCLNGYVPGDFVLPKK